MIANINIPSYTPKASRSLGWNPGVLTALAVALFFALSSGRDARPAAAQTAPPIRLIYKYHQLDVSYTDAARHLSDWEAKGWEAFQVVPIANPIPGAGGPMRMVLLFRRRA